MQGIIYERPGVYSSYSASSVTSRSGGRKAIGIVAHNEVDLSGVVTNLTTTEEALARYGSGTLADLVEVALGNGAASVYCVAIQGSDPGAGTPTETPSTEESLEEDTSGTLEIQEDLENQEDLVYPDEGEAEAWDGLPTTADYQRGFALLEEVENLPLILCDSTDLAVHQALRDSVVAASYARKERIGVVACPGELSVTEMTAHASEINHERMALVGGYYSESNPTAGILCAAGVAGLIAMETDPALPLNGLTLLGVPALERNYSDNEMDALIVGGVLPLELSSGAVSVVRGVSTRTQTDGVQDYTWRDLSAVLVVDDVIPSLRSALRSKFQRSKNTAQSRGAIRSQVVLELESKLSSEIIVSYGDITVEASEEDPTVCLVDFSFGVAHGLNQIWITAHVSV